MSQEQPHPKKNENLEPLGSFLRRIRLERGMSAVDVARSCHLSKQYYCDIEHGRKGQKLDMREVARLATCLEIPIEEITSRVDRLTNKEARQYSEYHRVLRSNTRAEQALGHVQALRTIAQELELGFRTRKDVSKALQRLERTIGLLDTTLAYRNPRPKRWAGEGDDYKLAPGRRTVEDLGKVG